MVHRFLHWCWPLVVLLAAVGAQGQEPAAGSAADAAYAEIRKLTVPPTGLTKEQIADRSDRLSRLAEAFYDRYPNDPRSLGCVRLMITSRRNFTGGTAEADRAAWVKKLIAIRESLIASPSATPNWVGVMEVENLYAVGDWKGDLPPDLTVARQLTERIAEQAPASDRRLFVETAYLDALAKSDPAAELAREKALAAHPEINPGVAQLAEGRLRIAKAQTEPLVMRFPAADGRVVDTTALRGKVVLIDFWATWCHDCMVEMPNVVVLYQKYHEKGLEVIGISFEKAPGAKHSSIERTPEQMVAFATAHQMPWPEYYDGKYWSNELGLNYSIREIPANFILGPDGRMVAHNRLGADLESTLKALLGP